mgnify:CR=1 FL=1
MVERLKDKNNNDVNGERFVKMNRLLKFVKENDSILEECVDCDGIAMGLLMALFDKASPTQHGRKLAYIHITGK